MRDLGLISILVWGSVSCSDEDLIRQKSDQQQRIASLKADIKQLKIKVESHQSDPPVEPRATLAEVEAEAREIEKLTREKEEKLADLRARRKQAELEAGNYRAKYALEAR